MFTAGDEELVWRYVKQSRVSLIAYLETLSPEQWNQQSLCDGWKVRDVLAHLILEYHYDAKRSLKDIVLSGLSINRFMKYTAVSLGAKPTAELIAMFRHMVDEQVKPAAIPEINVLVELMIHEQDIRIPLLHVSPMDHDYLRLVFKHWQPRNFNLGEKITGLAGRVNGLGFTLTDLKMSVGDGTEVIGTAQNVLMAVAGRKVTLDQLTGEGTAILKSRLA